jgi:DNA-binding response OmpR family regulator
MLTGRGDEHTAVELMKAGATDCLAKNGLSADRLAPSLRYATERRRLVSERDQLLVRERIDDPEYAHYRGLDEFPPHRLKETGRLFRDDKTLENKTVSVEGMRGRVDAERAVREAAQLYREKVTR